VIKIKVGFGKLDGLNTSLSLENLGPETTQIEEKVIIDLLNVLSKHKITVAASL